MNRSRAKRRLNAWRQYARRARDLTPIWWEDDRSTNGYVRAFRRWRWHPGAARSSSALWWNTDPDRSRWAKGKPESFVLQIIRAAADFKEEE